MHIPDGFVDAKTAVTSGVLAVTGVGIALWQAKRTLPARRVPMLGLASAFVFAAQMLNFPVAGGTSGHLIGATLVAVLLGPSAAAIALAAVLVVQCFLFNDGGLTALGANIFNMAIVATLVGYGVYRLVRRFAPGQRGLILAAAFAGWCSTVAAAISCAGQLAISGTVPWSVSFPAMAGVHMLIGIGEGLITALVILAITKLRADLLDNTTSSVATPVTAFVGFGLVAALGLALFVSPFACKWPDGLEKIAATLGFEHHALEKPLLPAPISNYALPGINSAVVATALAGVIGTVIVFALSWVLARVLIPKPTAESR
ncbi:MAG: energy-coupling factor ABC transporter permease [Verrucomicrobiia bacterium]